MRGVTASEWNLRSTNDFYEVSFCFREETLNLEPFSETINPAIRGQTLLVHAETVATFGVDV
jgi:hypothetical protein